MPSNVPDAPFSLYSTSASSWYILKGMISRHSSPETVLEGCGFLAFG